MFFTFYYRSQFFTILADHVSEARAALRDLTSAQASREACLTKVAAIDEVLA